MMAPDLSRYAQQANNVRSQFAAQSAANTFSRGLAQKRGTRRLGNAQQAFNRGYGNYAASFGRRGLAGGGIRSGVQQSAMANYLGDYTTSYADIQQANADEMRQFDFNQARFEAERDRALGDLELSKQNEIARAAQAIKALGPLFG